MDELIKKVYSTLRGNSERTNNLTKDEIVKQMMTILAFELFSRGIDEEAFKVEVEKAVDEVKKEIEVKLLENKWYGVSK